jgi:large subunit ribosomal protein L21
VGRSPQETAVYAIFEDGGKQYKVSQGDALLVETRELPEGQSELTFDKVLMVGEGASARIGQPFVAGATVTARIVDALRGPKLVGLKYNRRKGYRRKWGHRQPYLKVEISGINA